MKVDFATFCHKGDIHRLYAPGQLKRQVESNNFKFDEVLVVHQKCRPDHSKYPYFLDYKGLLNIYEIWDFDKLLKLFNVDIDKPQYVSNTDTAHRWQPHVVNHLAAVTHSDSDYIVFADSDCWMVRQPEDHSWVDKGIGILQMFPEIFIVSPNDGEMERNTRRMSQQMFMARTKEFRSADFNQPGWDGDVNVPGGPFPEYWALLEGRMELYCRQSLQFRYVLGPEYRYFHHNRLTRDGYYDTDYEKLGWI